MKPLAQIVPAAALAISVAAAAADMPEFKDSVLNIPRVDTAEQIGKYQNVMLQYDPQSATLRVTNLSELGVLKGLGVESVLPVLGAESVEVLMSGSNPAGVYLRIKGSDGGCQAKLRSQQRRQGNRFEVSLSRTDSGLPGACSLQPFRLTVPLEVYGLAAGTYSYSVNSSSGNITGSFTLNADNKLPGD